MKGWIRHRPLFIFKPNPDFTAVIPAQQVEMEKKAAQSVFQFVYRGENTVWGSAVLVTKTLVMTSVHLVDRLPHLNNEPPHFPDLDVDLVLHNENGGTYESPQIVGLEYPDRLEQSDLDFALLRIKPPEGNDDYPAPLPLSFLLPSFHEISTLIGNRHNLGIQSAAGSRSLFDTADELFCLPSALDGSEGYGFSGGPIVNSSGQMVALDRAGQQIGYCKGEPGVEFGVSLKSISDELNLKKPELQKEIFGNLFE